MLYCVQLASFYESRIYPLDANIRGFFFQETFPSAMTHT